MDPLYIDPERCESFIGHKLCPRCSKDGPCCEIEWVECWDCQGDGAHYDDAYDLEGEECGVCDGKGGYWMCLGRCDEHGQHKAAAATGAAPTNDREAP